jgi:hypothetical protein
MGLVSDTAALRLKKNATGLMGNLTANPFANTISFQKTPARRFANLKNFAEQAKGN